MVIGQVLCILPAILSGTTGNAWWSCISVVGYLAFMGGSVLLLSRFLRLDRLEGRRSLTWIGIASGVVAFGTAVALEILSQWKLGLSTTLWLAGPIEESGKLLVPFLLLLFGGPRFKIPRVGLYLVLISGATVGVIEGVEYQVRPDYAWAHLEMALVRPSAELLHVFVTGFAAAVIWLAAWRRKRAFTKAGTVAFLIAVGIHSFHDGIATFSHINPKSTLSSLAQTLHDAIEKGLSGGVFALGIAALLYLLARHAIRELTAPGDIAACPPPWRPQIKLWGCDRPIATAPVVDPWAPYAQYAPPGPVGLFGSPAYYAAPAYGAPSYGAPAYGAPSYAVTALPPMPAPQPVPSLATATIAPTLAAPPPPPMPPPLPPPMAPPGWYPMGGDPHSQAWWDGSTWSRSHHWDGHQWVPT
jgi:hypothetical protein